MQLWLSMGVVCCTISWPDAFVWIEHIKYKLLISELLSCLQADFVSFTQNQANCVPVTSLNAIS